MLKSSSLKAQRLSRFPASRVLHVVVTTVTLLMLTFFISSTLCPELRFLCGQPRNISTNATGAHRNCVPEDGIHPLPLPFACTVYPLLPGSQERLSHPACLWGDLLEHWSPLLVERGIGNHSLSARLWWRKWNVGWISRSAPVPADTLPLNGQGSSIITPCGANRRPSPSSIVCIH